jgi:hypothetical protein
VPAPPRNEICVDGEASGVPGCGETATEPADDPTAPPLAAAELAGDAPPQAASAAAADIAVAKVATGRSIARIL